MNSKERILTILNHEKSDMVPVTNRFTIEVSKELARILNLDYSDSFDLEVELGHDLLCTKEIGIVNAYSIEGNKKIGNNLFVDDFSQGQITFRKSLIKVDGFTSPREFEQWVDEQNIYLNNLLKQRDEARFIDKYGTTDDRMLKKQT